MRGWKKKKWVQENWRWHGEATQRQRARAPAVCRVVSNPSSSSSAARPVYLTPTSATPAQSLIAFINRNKPEPGTAKLHTRSGPLEDQRENISSSVHRIRSLSFVGEERRSTDQSIEREGETVEGAEILPVWSQIGVWAASRTAAAPTSPAARTASSSSSSSSRFPYVAVILI